MNRRTPMGEVGRFVVNTLDGKGVLNVLLLHAMAPPGKRRESLVTLPRKVETIHLKKRPGLSNLDQCLSMTMLHSTL